MTKCNNEHCPMRKDCYRYTAQSQWYQDFYTYDFKRTDIGVECDDYIYPASVSDSTNPYPSDSGEDSSAGF